MGVTGPTLGEYTSFVWEQARVRRFFGVRDDLDSRQEHERFLYSCLALGCRTLCGGWQRVRSLTLSVPIARGRLAHPCGSSKGELFLYSCPALGAAPFAGLAKGAVFDSFR